MESFDKFIEAHLKWRSNVAEDKIKGCLDLESVRRDDACEIGKWFHGPGQAQYGELPEFARALELHAIFHEAVSKSLVEYGQVGSDDEFKDLIKALKQLSNAISSRDQKEKCQAIADHANHHVAAGMSNLSKAALASRPCESCIIIKTCDLRVD